MELKEIEGVRVKAGDTLVVVTQSPLSEYQRERFAQNARQTGIKFLLLPPRSKMCIKENEIKQPVRWDADGNPYGDVSDEQLVALLCDALDKIRNRNGWSHDRR